MMQIMSNMKGTSAALPVAGQVLGSGSRVSKPQGAAGGGRKKQSGPYAGMTNKQIRQRKALDRQEKAIQEGVEARLAEAGSAAPSATVEAAAAGQNRDGGAGTALLENPREGHDVRPNGRGQASLDLGSVPSPNSESQAQPRRWDQAEESGTRIPDLFGDTDMTITPEPVRRGGSEDDEAYGRRPYRHPHHGQQ